MKCVFLFILHLALAHSLTLPQAAAAEDVQDQLREAQQAWRGGDTNLAVQLTSRVIESHPEDYRAYYLRGQFRAALGDHANAIDDYDRALARNDEEGIIHHFRGVEKFKLGRMKEAVADFDRYLEHAPGEAPRHWQRGIALYYAGEFQKGREQFELHQTYNQNDVENAVWHYLCVARQESLEEAREQLIPIRGDRRVPMREVHRLFAGEGTAQEVLDAAQSGRDAPEVRTRQLFYAHLYLGLYYEAVGDAEKTKTHIRRAAELSQDQSYMGAVARVHAALLKSGV